MDTKMFLSFLVLVLIGFSCSCHARDIEVGGKTGWVVNPPENYSVWASKNRFKVNDTLIFKYKKGADSVLAVNDVDYNTCNVTNPSKKMDDGESKFLLDRSGLVYFISGVAGSCGKGQKVIVSVLSLRPPAAPQKPGSPPSPTGPSPSAPSPSPSVKAPTPAPAPVPAPVPSPPDSSSPALTSSIVFVLGVSLLVAVLL